MLRTYGWMPCWRIVFSTFLQCMSFYTASTQSGPHENHSPHCWVRFRQCGAANYKTRSVEVDIVAILEGSERGNDCFSQLVYAAWVCPFRYLGGATRGHRDLCTVSPAAQCAPRP